MFQRNIWWVEREQIEQRPIGTPDAKSIILETFKESTIQEQEYKSATQRMLIFFQKLVTNQL